MTKHVPPNRDQRELDKLDQLENDQEPSQREPSEPVGALDDVGVLDLVWNLFEPLEYFFCGRVLADLEDDLGNRVVEHAEQGKDEQVGDDDECKVASGDSAIEARTSGGACESEVSINESTKVDGRVAHLDIC